MTALQWAVQEGHHDTARLLLAAGANPDQRIGRIGESFPLLWCAENNDLEMAKVMLEAGALAEGHPQSVQVIPERVRRDAVRRGIPFPEGEGPPLLNSHSPLVAAVSHGYLRFVQLMLTQGIDVEEHEIVKGGPMRAAAISGYPAMVEELLKAGALVSPHLISVAEWAKNTSHSGWKGPPAEVVQNWELTIAKIRNAL